MILNQVLSFVMMLPNDSFLHYRSPWVVPPIDPLYWLNHNEDLTDKVMIIQDET